MCSQGFLTDGVVGLAFVGVSKIQHPTFLEVLARANPDMDKVFAFRLTRREDPVPSEFHLGGFDVTVGGANPRRAYFPVVTMPSTLHELRSRELAGVCAC